MKSPTISILITSACSTLLAGCFAQFNMGATRTPASATPPADAWPTLPMADVERFAARTPTFPDSFELAPGVHQDWLNEWDRRRLENRPYTITHNEMYLGGLLRVWEEPQRLAEPDFISLMALLGDFEPNASFLTPRSVERARREARMDFSVSLPEDAFRFNPRAVSTKPMILPVASSEDVLLKDGLDIEFPPLQSRRPRGLVLHVLSLIPNKYEDRAIDELRRRGWAVITVDSDTSIQAPVSAEALARFDALATEYREHMRRAIEDDLAPNGGPSASGGPNRALFEIRRDRDRSYPLLSEMSKLSRGQFNCDSAPDAERVGAEVARGVDANLADHANAVAAVLDYIGQHRPDIPVRPLVIVGFSAGALVTPTIAAKLIELGRAPDAIVLVGGGADLLEISRHTIMRGTSIPIRSNNAEVPDSIWNAMHDSYRHHVRLEPLKTAPLLTGIPILQVHARHDEIVPARTGRLLYSLLGEPDRIDYFLGHGALFYHLGRVQEWIADWVEVHVPPSPDQNSPPSLPAPSTLPPS